MTKIDRKRKQSDSKIDHSNNYSTFIGSDQNDLQDANCEEHSDTKGNFSADFSATRKKTLEKSRRDYAAGTRQQINSLSNNNSLVDVPYREFSSSMIRTFKNSIIWEGAEEDSLSGKHGHSPSSVWLSKTQELVKCENINSENRYLYVEPNNEVDFGHGNNDLGSKIVHHCNREDVRSDNPSLPLYGNHIPTHEETPADVAMPAMPIQGVVTEDVPSSSTPSLTTAAPLVEMMVEMVVVGSDDDNESEDGGHNSDAIDSDTDDSDADSDDGSAVRRMKLFVRTRSDGASKPPPFLSDSHLGRNDEGFIQTKGNDTLVQEDLSYDDSNSLKNQSNIPINEELEYMVPDIEIFNNSFSEEDSIHDDFNSCLNEDTSRNSDIDFSPSLNIVSRFEDTGITGNEIGLPPISHQNLEYNNFNAMPRKDNYPSKETLGYVNVMSLNENETSLRDIFDYDGANENNEVIQENESNTLLSLFSSATSISSKGISSFATSTKNIMKSLSSLHLSGYRDEIEDNSTSSRGKPDLNRSKLLRFEPKMNDLDRSTKVDELVTFYAEQNDAIDIRNERDDIGSKIHYTNHEDFGGENPAFPRNRNHLPTHEEVEEKDAAFTQTKDNDRLVKIVLSTEELDYMFADSEIYDDSFLEEELIRNDSNADFNEDRFRNTDIDYSPTASIASRFEDASVIGTEDSHPTYLHESPNMDEYPSNEDLGYESMNQSPNRKAIDSYVEIDFKDQTIRADKRRGASNKKNAERDTLHNREMFPSSKYLGNTVQNRERFLSTEYLGYVPNGMDALTNQPNSSNPRDFPIKRYSLSKYGNSLDDIRPSLFNLGCDDFYSSRKIVDNSQYIDDDDYDESLSEKSDIENSLTIHGNRNEKNEGKLDCTKISNLVIHVMPCFWCMRGQAAGTLTTDRLVLLRLNILCALFTSIPIGSATLLFLAMLIPNILNNTRAIDINMEGLSPNFWSINGNIFFLGILGSLLLLVNIFSIRIIQTVNMVGAIRYFWVMICILPAQIYLALSLYGSYDVTKIWIIHWWDTPALSWFRNYFCEMGTAETLCKSDTIGSCNEVYNATDCAVIREEAQEKMLFSMQLFYYSNAVWGILLVGLLILIVSTLDRIITRPIVHKSLQTNIPAWFLIPMCSGVFIGAIFRYSPSSLVSERVNSENRWMGTAYLICSGLFLLAAILGWFISQSPILNARSKQRKHSCILLFMALILISVILLIYVLITSIYYSFRLVKNDLTEDQRGALACAAGTTETCTNCNDLESGPVCPQWTLDQVTRVLQAQVRQIITLAGMFLLYAISSIRFGFIMRKHLILYEIDYV